MTRARERKGRRRGGGYREEENVERRRGMSNMG